MASITKKTSRKSGDSRYKKTRKLENSDLKGVKFRSEKEKRKLGTYKRGSVRFAHPVRDL